MRRHAFATLVLQALVAAPARPQRSGDLRPAIMPPRRHTLRAMSDPRAGEHPPRIVLYVAGVGGAVVGGALGGLVGFSVDTQRCERRHRHDPPAFLFGPCFFPPVSGITETGWYAGSSTGATIGAAIVARARGCTTSDAAGGALVGALLGALPAALYLSGNDWKTPNGTRLTLATPVLQGMGAALALQGCRPPAARSRS